MTGKQLKNSILQSAIQGKLVPQDPNDEPASVLLEKIRAEKARLTKEGKIKKDKKESIIYRGEDNSYYEKFADGKVICIDDEIPFEIPNGWEWSRIRHIFTMQAGKNITANRIHTAQSEEHKYPCFGGNGLRGYVSNYNTEGTFPLVGRQGALCGNVNIASGKFYATEHAVVTDSYGLIDVNWAYFFLQALNLNQYATATAQPGLAVSNIIEVFIPLPPIAEQYRIVEKIQKLFPIIKRYSNAQIKLDYLNKDIKILIRKSILQEAIQGHLVPQDPNDELAFIFLQRIKEEKQRLVKEGKLKKKDAIDSVIFKGDDNKYYEQVGKEVVCIDYEIPFEMPASWCWQRGRGLFLPMESAKPKGDYFLYIDLDAVNNKQNVIDNAKRLSSNSAPSRAKRKLHQGDVLFSMVRPYLKNIALVSPEYAEGIASTGFYVITPSCALLPKYLFYMMLSPYVVEGLNAFMKGDNSPSINNTHIENFLYPIPPLVEQERIVERVAKVLDKIKE